MALKLIWLLFTAAGSLWVSWIRINLIRHKCFWDLNLSSSGVDAHAPSNSFSASKTWMALHPPGVQVNWHRSIWFKDRVPKHAFISWVVAWNRLHTRDRLKSWGFSIHVVCVLCNSGDESREHLFFNCPYSSAVWTYFTRCVGLSPPTSFMASLLWLKTASTSKNLSLIIKLLFQASIYLLLRERNSRIHTSSFLIHLSVVEGAQLSDSHILIFESYSAH
ncbi:putative reverse transcriptase zinc-binding domain-containing protein [Arabidopsis thaliana]